jgi:hypothetical protein
MGIKADYTPEEWAEVVAGPYFASLYIVIADPNFAYFKELAAMTGAVMDSASKSANDFIKAVAVDLSSKETQEGIREKFEELKGHKDPEALNAAIVGRVTNAADIVAGKSAEDDEAYREWLLYLAKVTAEASKEGGFLGVGAVRVSEKEEKGLDELADALGVSAAA